MPDHIYTYASPEDPNYPEDSDAIVLELPDDLRDRIEEHRETYEDLATVDYAASDVFEALLKVDERARDNP